LGSGGAVAILILVFMAVTSASSAELIAVASIITYDVYRSYIKKDATSKQLINFSHIIIGVFGLIMGVLGIILKFIGISLGYLYLMMGIIVSPAVFPIFFALTWRKQNIYGAIGACIVGFIAGVASWLAVAYRLYGVITLTSTGENYPMLAGNLVSLGASCIFTVVVSLLKPDDFDGNVTKDGLKQLMDEEDKDVLDPAETDEVKLNRAANIAYWSSIVLTIVLIVVWPIPMFLSKYVFSEGFFTGWVSFGMAWAIIAAITVIFLPIFESRAGIMYMLKGMGGDVTGKKPVPTSEKKAEEAASPNDTVIA